MSVFTDKPDYTTPFTDEECAEKMQPLIDQHKTDKQIVQSEYKQYLKQNGIPEERGKICLDKNDIKIVGDPDVSETAGTLNPEGIPVWQDISRDNKPPVPAVTANAGEGFQKIGEYQIKKDESIKTKIVNATDAYRVTKGADEYVVFKGATATPMTGGRKSSKSQKRGGKKQRQTKRKWGGRRRSQRRR